MNRVALTHLFDCPVVRHRVEIQKATKVTKVTRFKFNSLYTTMGISAGGEDVRARHTMIAVSTGDAGAYTLHPIPYSVHYHRHRHLELFCEIQSRQTRRFARNRQRGDERGARLADLCCLVLPCALCLELKRKHAPRRQRRWRWRATMATTCVQRRRGARRKDSTSGFESTVEPSTRLAASSKCWLLRAMPCCCC